jgi:hypothetical protein
VSRGLCLLCGLALTIAVSAGAQARDFEMGGDSPYVYSSTAPAPNAVTRHRAAAPRIRRVRWDQAAKPLAKQ